MSSEPKAFDLLVNSVVGQVFSLEGTEDKYLITGIDTNYTREIGGRACEYPIQTYNLSCRFKFDGTAFPTGFPIQNCSLDILNRMTRVKSLKELTEEEAHKFACWEIGSKRAKESQLAMAAQES